MESILIPRRIEGRQQQRIKIDQQYIQKYIKDGCKGDLNLYYSPITKLPDNLVRVEGHLNLEGSKIVDFNNLKYVGFDLLLWNVRNLKEEFPFDLIVKGKTYLGGSNIGAGAKRIKISKLYPNLNVYF